MQDGDIRYNIKNNDIAFNYLWKQMSGVWIVTYDISKILAYQVALWHVTDKVIEIVQ